MLRLNFLLAIRSLKKYKSSFIINLLGLTIGLSCFMLIYLWVDDELKMDKFHLQDPYLFQVMEHQKYANEILTTTSTPGLLAETLKEEIPEIKYAATTTWISPSTLSIGAHNVKAKGFHVGKDYFNIFSYKLNKGQPEKVLEDKSSIVISNDLALRLFNTTDNVIGSTIEYQHEQSFIVSGIFETIPDHSSYKFDFVLPYEDYKANNEWVHSWKSNGPSTYVILDKQANVNNVNAKIKDFVLARNEDSNVELFVIPYSDRYLYGSYSNGKPDGGRIEYLRLFSIIAICILAIACINFMNLATARASRRAKEVGIKKTIGSGRRSLIYQFIGESLVLALISMICAIVIVWLFLPNFNIITDKTINLNLGFERLFFCIFIVLVTGFIAGSYPALYLSNFNPVKVLKGTIKGSFSEMWIRQGLVIFQFTLSVILIICVIAIYQQIEYVQNKNLGYNKDNVIQFPIEGRIETNLETFLMEIRSIPGVIGASSIGHSLVGQQNNTSGLNWEGKDPTLRVLFENVRVNYELIESMDIEILTGRSFQREFGADSSKIIFNEAAMKILGFEDPLGKSVRLWDRYDLEIIGVVKDFHFQSMHEDINPLFFMLDPDNTWNVMIRIEAGEEKNVIAGIETFYSSFNPGFGFEFEFLDDNYAQLYRSEERVSTLSMYFAGLAIVISCLGLFGLATFTAERRLKEIGIRKTLGSGPLNIMYLLSKDFIILVLISILIALPIGYLLIENWMSQFAYRSQLSIWTFVGAGLTALLVALLTISSQAIRAANVNPVNCLRAE